MRKRVLAVSSAGGHWVQLLRLQRLFDNAEVTFASVQPGVGAVVAPSRFYVVTDANRFRPWRMLPLGLGLLRMLVREKPQVVISTGALPGLVAIALAKLFFRSTTIWIDSIANHERLSISGRYARWFADVYLTQWPHLSGDDGPHYWGAVI